MEAIEAAGGTAIAKCTDLGIKSDVVDMVSFAVETYGSLAADNIERADPEAMAEAVAARPSAWTEGAFYTPDHASDESNVRSHQERKPARQGALRSMKLLGLDHVGIVVRDIDETVTRAGDTLDGRSVGERFVSDDIDLQVLMAGESTLELIEVRNPGFGMPKLKDGETAVIGHFGIEVDNLEDAKTELTGRGVALEGEADAGEVRFIFTVPQTTFGVTLQLMEHKGRAKGS